MAAPLNVSAGDLNRQVVLQRKTTTRNELGEAVEAWNDLLVCWAAKMDGAGVEADRAGEVAGQINSTFIIRYTAFRPPLNPRDRLLFNEDGGPPIEGLIYNIRKVASVGDLREFQQIDAAARADQAAP